MVVSSRANRPRLNRGYAPWGLIQLNVQASVTQLKMVCVDMLALPRMTENGEVVVRANIRYTGNLRL